jgi:hypothetical protein
VLVLVLGVFNSILLIIFKIFIRNSGHVPSPRTFSGSTVCPSRNAGGTSSGRGGCFHVRSTMSHLHKRRARPDTNGVFSHLPIVGRWVIYTIDISVTRSTIYPIAPASFAYVPPLSPLPPMVPYPSTAEDTPYPGKRYVHCRARSGATGCRLL